MGKLGPPQSPGLGASVHRRYFEEPVLLAAFAGYPVAVTGCVPVAAHGAIVPGSGPSRRNSIYSGGAGDGLLTDAGIHS